MLRKLSHGNEIDGVPFIPCGYDLPSNLVVPDQKSRRVSVDRLIRQADVLAAWRAWWTRQVATWAVVLALVLAAGIALAWRAYAVAQSTHEILQQILENQTKMQATKGGKRR